MAVYLSYEEYQQYGGDLDETTFNDFAFEAKAQIDWYTFNRLENFDEMPDAVPRCMYYLIKLFKEERNALIPATSESNSSTDNRTIASQSNDGVSVSYNILSASELAERSAMKINTVINKYLGNITDSLGRRILYRGLYPNE